MPQLGLPEFTSPREDLTPLRSGWEVELGDVGGDRGRGGN